jgi:hypothetical protein
MKYQILCIFLLLYLSIFGQKDSTIFKKERYEFEPHLYFSIGLSLQKQLVGDVGIIYGKGITEHSGFVLGMMGIKLASEFNFNRDNFFIAPKISAEIHVFLVGLRFSVIDYTNYTYHDVKITPEIGVTGLGYVSLFYGYNFSMNNSRLDYVDKHRLSLTFNINKFLIQRLKDN